MQPRLIILEDEYLIRYSLTKKLTKYGYEVLSYSDPTFCTAALGGGQTCQNPQGLVCADFLLTDNKMPNMNGLEFVEQQLKSGCNGGFRNKAVMSAVWSEEDILRADQLGCKVFHKPFSLDEILDWLEEGKSWLKESRQLSAL